MKTLNFTFLQQNRHTQALGTKLYRLYGLLAFQNMISSTTKLFCTDADTIGMYHFFTQDKVTSKGGDKNEVV